MPACDASGKVGAGGFTSAGIPLRKDRVPGENSIPDRIPANFSRPGFEFQTPLKSANPPVTYEIEYAPRSTVLFCSPKIRLSSELLNCGVQAIPRLGAKLLRSSS